MRTWQGSSEKRTALPVVRYCIILVFGIMQYPNGICSVNKRQCLHRPGILQMCRRAEIYCRDKGKRRNTVRKEE